MRHVWGTGEGRTGFWSGELKERDHFKDRGLDGG
jgi:hypothetical protein